jgi:uncharacterized protein involved in copper resistance
MRGAWIDTDAPLYLVRMYGLGENVVRNGDLIEAVLSGAVAHPHGPMWLAQAKLDALTKAQRKALKAMGVTHLKAIPERVCQ